MSERIQMFNIPNLLTLGNLGCGVLSIWMATHGRMELALWLIVIAGVLDFLDGFVARALKSFSPIGADLDSLADVVTFGVAPGVIMMTVLDLTWSHILNTQEPFVHFHDLGLYDLAAHPLNANFANRLGDDWISTIVLCGPIIIPLFGALRLAKFNVDTTPYPGFNGLPIPANALFFVGLVPWVDAALQNPDMPMAGMLANPYFLAGTCVVIATCMILPIPLMALKFKGFGLQKNIWKYLMIVSAVTLGAIFQLKALSFILLLYFLLSAGEHFSRKTQASDEVQS